MDYAMLKRRVRGATIEVFDPEHRELCDDLIWNGRKPAAHPRYVVRAACVEDVQLAVRFAAANGLKISPRGGGHNFTGIALNGNVVVDVSGLDHLNIDAKSASAFVGPGVTNERLAAALDRQGYAFPVGHCATVPVSGYLLGGGVGWNSGEWGIACFSVIGADVVMADGELLHVDENNSPEILWAVRGAGPEFFGIVTSYHVRLQPAPKAIMTSVRVYLPSEARRVGEWAEAAMASAPANLEFTVKISAPPPEANAPVGAFVIAAIGTAFAASERDARHILDALFASAPEGAVETVDLIPTPFNALYDLTSVSTPKGKRYAVDTLWSDASFAEILDRMVAGYSARPSMESFALLALRSPLSLAPGDAAFSRIGRVFSSIYTVWDGEQNDKANMDWLRQTMMEIEPLATGTYVGESDLEREGRSVGIHSPEVALKLSTLRAKYDSRRIFRSLVAETARTSAA